MCKSLYKAPNIISLEDFGYIKEPSCENIYKAYYCALFSDIVISLNISKTYFK